MNISTKQTPHGTPLPMSYYYEDLEYADNYYYDDRDCGYESDHAESVYSEPDHTPSKPDHYTEYEDDGM
jgi:hypothetical protein